jgi:hypothetical protein
LLGAFSAYFILRLIGNLADDADANIVLSVIANVISVVLAILAIPGLIGGIGLMKRKNWARILVLILSIVNILNFPLGTAIGIYALWVLLQPEVTAAFEKPVQL